MFKTVVNNAKTDDIIHALGNAVPAAIAQAKAANLPEVIGLTGGNILNDGIKAGYWVRENVIYKIDDFENQNIQLPSAALRNGFADCKSFSLLFCAIMNAAGYDCGFRFARYKNRGSFTHVYNIVVDNKKNIFTFDTCLKDLKELKHYKEIKDMNVNYIAGAPLMIQERAILRGKKKIKKPTLRQLMRDDRFLSPGMSEPDGIGRKKGGGKFFKKLGNFVKKGAEKVKTIGLAPARGPFLVLVDLNFRGIARRLNKLRENNASRYQEFWTKLGGNINALNKAVDKGKNKKPLFGQKKGINGATSAVYIGGEDSIMAPENFEYVGEPLIATVTAALTAASGILVSLTKLFKKEGVQAEPGEGDLEEGIDPNTPVSPEVEPGQDFFANDPASETAAKYAESGGKNVPAILPSTKGLQATSDQVTTSFKLSPMLLIGGAAAVLGIILLTKKKK